MVDIRSKLEKGEGPKTLLELTLQVVNYEKHLLSVAKLSSTTEDKANTFATFHSPQGKPNGKQQGGKGHSSSKESQKESPAVKAKNYDGVTCFNCGKSGHVQRFCKESSEKPKSSPDVHLSEKEKALIKKSKGLMKPISKELSEFREKNAAKSQRKGYANFTAVENDEEDSSIPFAFVTTASKFASGDTPIRKSVQSKFVRSPESKAELEDRLWRSKSVIFDTAATVHVLNNTDNIFHIRYLNKAVNVRTANGSFTADRGGDWIGIGLALYIRSSPNLLSHSKLIADGGIVAHDPALNEYIVYPPNSNMGIVFKQSYRGLFEAPMSIFNLIPANDIPSMLPDNFEGAHFVAEAPTGLPATPLAPPLVNSRADLSLRASSSSIPNGFKKSFQCLPDGKDNVEAHGSDSDEDVPELVPGTGRFCHEMRSFEIVR